MFQLGVYIFSLHFQAVFFSNFLWPVNRSRLPWRITRSETLVQQGYFLKTLPTEISPQKVINYIMLVFETIVFQKLRARSTRFFVRVLMGHLGRISRIVSWVRIINLVIREETTRRSDRHTNPVIPTGKLWPSPRLAGFPFGPTWQAVSSKPRFVRA